MRSTLSKKILLMASVVILSACGGGSDTATTAPADPKMALLQLYAENPDLALQIAPLTHSELQPTSASLQQSPLSSRALISSIVTQDDCPGLAVNQSIADLQTNYEGQFCQIKGSVSLQSQQCQSNIAYINQQAGAGYFNLSAKPILNNPLGVTGISFEPVTYTTHVDLPLGRRDFNVSGGLIFPQGITGDQIKGVVTYFHGTTFNKCLVGSNYSQNGETRLLAEVFASQGYIVVVPDYIGQGQDWPNVHPYVLYPKVSAKTAVDMLTAVVPKIQKAYQLSPSQKLKLFSAGYSEGGAYSLWFSSFLNDQPETLDPLYELKHSVGMEGAYVTSTVTKGYLFDDVAQSGSNVYNIQTQVLTNLVKPLLSADAFLSYATYQLAGVVKSVFNMDFYSLQFACLQSVPPEYCNSIRYANIAEAFARKDANAATPILASALGKSANGATYPTYKDIVYSYKNSVNSLVSSALLGASGQADLDAALRNADVNLSALPDAAVSIISLNKDSVVTPNNFTTLQAKYPDKIKNAYLIPANKLQVVSPVTNRTVVKITDNSKVVIPPEYVDVDHMHALVYEFLYALNIFNQF